MADDNDPVVMRFRGDGTARIPGVPMRDLTKSDVAALAPDALREAMASDLYGAVAGTRLPVNRGAVAAAETTGEPAGTGQATPAKDETA